MGRRMWFWWGAGEGGKLVLFPFLAGVHIHLLGPDYRGEPGRGRGVRLAGTLACSGPPAVGRQRASSVQCRRPCGVGHRCAELWVRQMAGKMSWAMKTTAVEKGRALGVRRGTRSY